MDKTQNFSDKQTVNKNNNFREYQALYKNQNFHDNEAVNRSQNCHEYQTAIRNQNSCDNKALNKNQNCHDTQTVNRNQNLHDDEIPDDDHLYHPYKVHCENCGLKVVPIQKVRPSYKAHLLATTLFLFLCPCSILPYYIDSLQVTELYCPYCDQYLMTV